MEENCKKCGRWSPTGEQVKVLTELFRAGLRTPSTDQIQRISAQLSFYGKIESKNVFYWFQNHKARERHKRRRVLINRPPQSNDSPRVLQTLQLFPLAPGGALRKDTISLHPQPHPPLDLQLSSL